MRVVIRVSIVAACLVVAPDTASAQGAPAVNTHVIARTATDEGTYHYAQIFQQRGRWILPDLGDIDFNKFDDDREVWVGAGGVLLATTHLSVIGEGHIVKALGPSSGGALYLQPWVLVVYHLTHKLGGEAVYFPYLPLNDAGGVSTSSRGPSWNTTLGTSSLVGDMPPSNRALVDCIR